MFVEEETNKEITKRKHNNQHKPTIIRKLEKLTGISNQTTIPKGGGLRELL